MSLRYIARDLNVICAICGLKGKLKIILMSHAFHLVLFIRIAQSASGVPILGNLLRAFTEYFIRVFFSSDISCKAKIGPGFQIQHGHDIVIGADVSIGENCKIFNGVTLGNKDTSKPSKGQQPLIGNDVTLGTGSKILGPVSIGNNCKVGANSVVLNNFPDNSVIVGIPALGKKRK